MDLSALTPETIVAQQAAMTGSAFGIGVARKVLDMAQVEGADLAQLIASSGSVGRNLNVTA